MSKSRKNPSPSWSLAASLCEVPASGSGKAEAVLDQYVTQLSSRERAQCQRLFYGYLRHARLIDFTIGHFVPRKPKPKLTGLLRAALADLLESKPEKQAPVVDFWVGKTRISLSKGEAGLLNAVLRKVPDFWCSETVSGNPALKHSHPDWLFKSWTKAHGKEVATGLMTWNQRPTEVYFRLRGEWEALPTGCTKTQWPDFVRWAGDGDWSEIQEQLDKGRLYAQDPGTRLAPEYLDVCGGESVLDLCAAPGGKSLMLADALGTDPTGQLVCVEQPGPRIEQLDENLRKLTGIEGPEVQLLTIDVLELTTERVGQFDAVLLDAPCSNTGVIRRRPDVKWRLKRESVPEMASLQKRLLNKAAELVKPGGRLVYSTCSIEPEENQDLVMAFLAEQEDFKLVVGQTFLPTDTGHDGAGVFLMNRD